MSRSKIQWRAMEGGGCDAVPAHRVLSLLICSRQLCSRLCRREPSIPPCPGAAGSGGVGGCSQLSEGTNCSNFGCFTPKEQVGQKYQTAASQTNYFWCLVVPFAVPYSDNTRALGEGAVVALTALMSLLNLMSGLSSSEVFHTRHVPCVV